MSETHLIRVGHSPDPDDAFMFYALAKETIDTGPYKFKHELVDIEKLNRRAFAEELELTALSVHAYAYLSDKYVICNSGASMGDGYGPMVIAREEQSVDWLKGKTIAVPGELTSAFLTLQLRTGGGFEHVVVPFDKIIEATAEGEWQGQPLDAGLIIHEGQLTYGRRDLKLIVDLGAWWKSETSLPLPLGCNGVRRDLGPKVIRDVQRLLKQSIEYGLAHREEALEYALGFGRGLDARLADEFVGMYVNDWTVDFGDKGREAVALLLKRGYKGGFIPRLVVPEFVG